MSKIKELLIQDFEAEISIQIDDNMKLYSFDSFILGYHEYMYMKPIVGDNSLVCEQELTREYNNECRWSVL